MKRGWAAPELAQIPRPTPSVRAYSLGLMAGSMGLPRDANPFDPGGFRDGEGMAVILRHEWDGGHAKGVAANYASA